MRSFVFLKYDFLFFQRDLFHNVAVFRQFLFVLQERMIDRKTKDLFNLIKRETDMIVSVFFYPYP